MIKSVRDGFAVLIVAVVVTAMAFVFFLPAWQDGSSGEEVPSYVLSDNAGMIGEYEDLGDVFSAIYSNGGKDFTITVRNNDTITGSFAVNEGINVVLTSFEDKTYTITSAAGVRHFTVTEGSLTLENIILDGGKTGGGIDVSVSGLLVMNKDATINNCTAVKGGAVYSEGMFIMNDGKISGNESKSPGMNEYYSGGGGVYNTGTFIMNSGEISDNAAISPIDNWYNNGGGGGVYNLSGTFIMTGGEISGNKVTNDATKEDNSGGGGVYNYNGTYTKENGSFDMNGDAMVSDNYAAMGGGVYNFRFAEMTMNDSATISGNTGMSGGGVYNVGTLTMKPGTKINNNSSIYVNPPGLGYGGGVYNVGTMTMYDRAEVSNNTADLYGGGVYNYGEMYVAGSLMPSVFTMYGGEINNNKVGAGSGGGGVASIDGGTFNMYGGEISGNFGGLNGGGMYNDSSKFVMEGGSISGNSVANYSGNQGNGGGVYNYFNGVFTMSGGEISGNKAETIGGGVYNYYSSTFTMIGGAISGNTAINGGGVYNYYADATFTIIGGAISGNTAINGGGVYNYYADATFTMIGGAISGNTAGYGGGIFNASLLSITGGNIIGNTATSLSTNGTGGGIYTTDYTMLTVLPASGNEIVFSGNTASTLRTKDITNNISVYNSNIGDVKLDEWVSSPVNKNAPAYNNFDINSPGDAYVVFIFITPNGSGTVTVTDSNSGNEYATFTKDGWVHVLIAADPITLSEAPESGYEFERFFMNSAPADSIDPASVKISGNTSITAMFVSTAPPPEPNNITATADSGSTIDPSGVVKVPAGEDITFTFTAKPGHKITAVYVDGKAISSADLASGKYTFANVTGDHQISVISKAEGGSGAGGGNGNGTGGSGTGGGNENGGSGTGTGGSGGDGTGTTVSGNGDGQWAVLNLICAILAVLTGLVGLIAGRNRLRANNEEKRSKAALTLRAFALIIGIVSVIVFFLTEDWSLPVAPVDGWTLLMFIMFLATMILAMVSFGFDKEPEEKAKT